MRWDFLWGFVAANVLYWPAADALAQRAGDNAVAEASDAFGTQVGREQIGLYSSGNARGFSPSQAGNLRVEGLYFDMVGQANSAGRVFRGSSVHVGISAQGYAFPAPTGVVDFRLRRPTDEYAAGVLVGASAYNQTYAEVDVQAPIVKDVLRIGGGFGYSRNTYYRFATDSHDWNAGVIADWQPTDRLRITPFWSRSRIYEYGSKTQTFLGRSGYPRFRSKDLPAQSWGALRIFNENAGATAHFTASEDWELSAGLFWSKSGRPETDETYLFNVDSFGDGDYAVSLSPERYNSSVSGELRTSRAFQTVSTINTFHMSLKGRDRMNEFGGSDRRTMGRANLLSIPLLPTRPALTIGSVGTARAQQGTLGIGYDGIWRDVGQITAGIQKSYYRRTTETSGTPEVSARSCPLVYNLGVAAYLSDSLAAYASYTRGFEEVANAPPNAANRDEAVPAQITKQIDAGLRYSLTDKLNVVAGVFQIEKPYYNVDAVNFYRRIGTTSHRGFEFSLAGTLTDGLTVIAGATYIDPEVTNDLGGTFVAIGPVPLLIRVDAQYRLPWMPQLTLEGRVERLSDRYATSDRFIQLPAVTTIDAGFRYTAQLFDRDVTVRLQGLNLTDRYGVRVQSSGSIEAFEGRRLELSLAVDF